MKKEKQIAIISQVLSALDDQENTFVDGTTKTIDSTRYVDCDRFEQEKEKLFKQYPIVVGAASRLEKEGDYFLHEALGVPIVVIKGNDGRLRAFLNSCRHRGVKLLTAPQGNIRRNIVCPYHAWTYDLQGCLKTVFHSQGFVDVSKESHSLIELDCWVRLGMVFVLPDVQLKGTVDLDAWLEEVAEQTEGFDFGDLVAHAFSQEILPFNWKLLVDGALEGYHFKIAHAQTIGPYFLDNMSIPMEAKIHSSIVFPKKNLEKLKTIPKAQWDLRQVANILIHLFPNVILLIEPDHIMVVSFVPLSPTQTQYHAFMLLPKGVETEKEASYWALNEKIFWDAIEEDNTMAALQQKSFSMYSNQQLTVGSFESLLYQFEAKVDEILQS